MERERKIVPLPTLESKTLKVSAIIVVIAAIIVIVVVGIGDYNLAKVERDYEASRHPCWKRDYL